MGRHTTARSVFALVAVLSIAVVGADVAVSADSSPPSPGATVDRESLDGMTMVSSQSEGLFLFSEDGSVAARLTAEDAYFDADHVSERGQQTILYTAADYRPPDRCGFSEECIENQVVLYNLSTGEHRSLFSMTTKRHDDEQWHDADYLGPHRIVVADLAHDRVFVANTTTGVITWEWQAHQAYDTSSGGRDPEDWTHINDVEVLPDGRVMVSVRNHDQVVFLDPDIGVDDDWTLGRDHDPSDENKTLYEQHNPDYIPRSEGGPAVLVADSEHNRVVEFQRNGSAWERSWRYERGLNWPRDADRLPNGHTLITDSRDNEVLEVNRSGTVVWRQDVPLPYEAERLGTGPESTGSPSATDAGLDSVPGGSGQGEVYVVAKQYLPDRVVNGASFVVARYPVSLRGVVALALGAVTVLAWGAAEWWWSRYRLRLPVVRK